MLTGNGTFSVTGDKLQFADDGNNAFVPTADPRYMICLNKTTGELREIDSGKTVATFSTPAEFREDVFRDGAGGRMHPYQLVLDQRIYSLPGQNLLATIPLTDDRLLFHEIDFGVSVAAGTGE